MKVGSKALGLAIGPQSILLAEVSVRGDKPVVSKSGEFVFPEGISLSTPEKLGSALQAFLKSNGYSVRDAVIGLPAKRLVTRRKDIPAATLAVAASTLRLQAEGEFSSELDNLVMDFAGTPSGSEPSTVLLVATNRVVVDECQAMARAAGLKVYGITSTTAALGRATSRLPGGDGFVLSIGRNSAELVVQHGSDPTHLRHLNVPTGNASMGQLAGEIQRTMAGIPRNGTPMTLALWRSGSEPADENPQSILEKRLSMPVTLPELGNLVKMESQGAEAFAPAVAVALTALQPEGLPVDFLNSRMTPPKDTTKQKQQLAIIAVLILLLAGGYGLYWPYSVRAATLAKKQNELTKAKEEAAKVERIDKMVVAAENWMPKGQNFIEVLREVTAAFPRPGQGPEIFAKSLTNTQDNVNGITTWQLDGTARNSSQIIDLAGRMQDNEKLSTAQVTRQVVSPTGIEFTITFVTKAK